MSRNIVITGGNSGIGLEMARAFASSGDRVVIGARDQAKSREAIEQIREEVPDAKLESMRLDLSDTASIDCFALELLHTMPAIDVLILNAGLYARKLEKLDNGLESMIGIMHFGHFRLTRLLLPALQKAEQGRIVVTSSVMHRFGRIDEASFHEPWRHLLAMQAYAQAKLANLLFTRELARRLADTRITVNAFHPGAVATGIWREMPGWMQKMMGWVLLTPEQGADTAIWLANDPSLTTASGGYYEKRRLAETSDLADDKALAARLWELSEEYDRAAQA